MTSADCAHIFGSFINEKAGWNFDLVDFNCHVLCYMLGASFQVQLMLTTESLHRRNIIHYGITTLRATICHGLLREAAIELGDIVLDPMVGCGSIPIEGLNWRFLLHRKDYIDRK